MLADLRHAAPQAARAARLHRRGRPHAGPGHRRDHRDLQRRRRRAAARHAGRRARSAGDGVGDRPAHRHDARAGVGAGLPGLSSATAARWRRSTASSAPRSTSRRRRASPCAWRRWWSSRGLLPMLGIAPVAGRTFSADEDRAGGPKVALISESLWTRSFGRAPQAHRRDDPARRGGAHRRRRHARPRGLRHAADPGRRRLLARLRRPRRSRDGRRVAAAAARRRSAAAQHAPDPADGAPGAGRQRRVRRRPS